MIDFEAAMAEYRTQVEHFLSQLGVEIEKWEPTDLPARKILAAGIGIMYLYTPVDAYVKDWGDKRDDLTLVDGDCLQVWPLKDALTEENR